MKKIRNFIYWCSGCNVEVLLKHKNDQPKYFGIGLTILITAVMASLTGGYAFMMIFSNSITAVFFGLFWGLLIFNLDRFIISSSGVSDGTAKITKEEWINAIPRLILAITIGIIIALPLEIRLFEKEINAEINAQNSTNPENAVILIGNRFVIIDSYYSELSLINEEINFKKELRRSLYKNYMKLVSSNETEEKQVIAFNNYEMASKQWNDFFPRANNRISELSQTIADLIVEKENEIRNVKNIEERNSGILAKYIALNKITNENKSAMTLRIFITLLLILIEIVPIIFKLMTVDGPYEEEIQYMNAQKIKKFK